MTPAPSVAAVEIKAPIPAGMHAFALHEMAAALEAEKGYPAFCKHFKLRREDALSAEFWSRYAEYARRSRRAWDLNLGGRL